ncbi:MAG: uroporphyrinogen-III synthase [Gemmatimonadota bacterium]
MAVRLPLEGYRVLVTRAVEQADALAAALTLEGAEVVAFPTIAIRPLDDQSPIDDAIARLDEYQWIAFTSVNAVSIFFDRLKHAGRSRLPASLRVAAVGPVSAEALANLGVVVDFIPADYQGGSLGAGMNVVAGMRVLFPRAVAAREELVASLRLRGAIVDDFPIYQTGTASPTDAAKRELARGVDIATFTSPSTVRALALLTDSPPANTLGRAIIACIGPSTAEAARAAGLDVAVQPREHTTAGLVRGILDYLPTTKIGQLGQTAPEA